MQPWSLVAAATAALTACWLAAPPVSAQQAGPTSRVPVEVLEEARDTTICVLDPDLPAAAVGPRARGLTARYGGTGVRRTYTAAIKGFAARGLAERARMRLVADNPDVLTCEPDGVVTIVDRPGSRRPPWERGGDGGGGGGQTTPWGIERVGGGVNGTFEVTGRKAWVIDTGIDLDHPDLNVDAACSANFVPRGKNSPDDGHGHGTHVAGTIGAIDNAVDVVGVAAGATLCAVRVLDNSGSGTYSDVIAGVDWVARPGNGAPGDVVNMSLGGPPYDLLSQAVMNAADAGILFAVAAGNDGDHAGNHEPARVDHLNVYTVSAIDDRGALASWSNYGNPPVDLAAPGVNILSTKKGGGTTTYSGTSMATPHVAGVLLLLGAPNCDGYAAGDPDSVADPIVSVTGGGCPMY